MYKSNIGRLSDNDLVNLCRESDFNDKMVYCCMSDRFCEIFVMHNRNKFRVFNARKVRLSTAKQQQMYEVIGRYIEDLTVSHGVTGEPNNMDVILSKCPNLKTMVWIRLNEQDPNYAFNFSGQQLCKLNRLREIHLILGTVKTSYFTKICANIHKLHKIHIDVVDGVSNEALLQLAKYCSKLEEVFIRLNNNQVDAEHLAKLRSLKKLHLVTTEQYTKPLTPLLVGLVDNHDKRLEWLAIETTIFPRQDILILASFFKLQQLLIHCEKFEDESVPGIEELYQLGVIPNLMAVYVHNSRYNINHLEMLQLMQVYRKVNFLCVKPTAEKFPPEFYKNAKEIILSQRYSKTFLTLGNDLGPMTAEEKALVDEETFKIIPSEEVRQHILGEERNYE